MLFSSFAFLLVFLPLVIITYFLIKNRTYRNIILFLFSLVFYAWGEPIYVLLMLFSIIINYFFAIYIDNAKNKHKKKKYLILSIVVNILIIGFFKYSNFLINNINFLLHTSIPNLNLALPIGISFYTFQILSYIIDVYNKKVSVQRNIINLGTYIALFPQLIAGPIVRYETIAEELENRKENLTKIIEGLKRFIIGLGKKVIIANNMAIIADTIYNGDIASYGTIAIWLAAIAYTFQIYFDFSGYSDMAIGLGKVFGFTFLENFNYPYIANSITDFWRRWHISLSTWFRDYVYIPLGGNRVSKIKWFRNILIVWLLTGLWHGASWNFVLWGLYYGVILIIEKIFLGKLLEKLPKFITHIYTLFIIVIGWVIFRLEDFSQLGLVLGKMFSFQSADLFEQIIFNFDIFAAIPYLIIAVIASMPIIKNISDKNKNKEVFHFIANVCTLGVFVLSICLLLSSTYNPFIYFRF